MATTRDKFQASIERYRRIVAFASVGAFALFVGILWTIIIALGPNLHPIRKWAFAFSGIGEILFALSFMLTALAIPATLLIVIIRRANRDPNVRCPACGKLFWENKIVRPLMTDGRCLQCEHRLFPAADEEERNTVSTHSTRFVRCTIRILLLGGFGVLFITTAIDKPAPESYNYWVVASVNLLIAGWAIFRETGRVFGNGDDPAKSADET